MERHDRALRTGGTEGEARRSRSRTGGLDAYWVTAEVRWKSSAFAAAQTLSLTTLKIRTPP